jgi:RNA polymerase sigma-70 factor (ECF subfamily)
MLTTPQTQKAEHIDPDADLIFGLKAGDERALAGLMDRHMQTIHSQAFYMLGDQMAAEDVTQTVFLKTWEHDP